MRGFTKAAIAICVSSLTQILAAPATPFEIVETENGSITGHRSAKAEAVWEYLGIPYAQPPLGELRFAPPQKYTANGSFIAEKFVCDKWRRALSGLILIRRDSVYVPLQGEPV